MVEIGGELVREFLEVEFEQLGKLVFHDLFRETERVEEADVLQYMQLCSWALRVVRAKYAQEKAQSTPMDAPEVAFSWVLHVM